MMIRVLAIATALALPSVALAGPDKAPPADKSTDKAPVKTDKNAKIADGDVKIIAHLHHVNQIEIDMGKLAQKSGTQAIKSYAEALVNDHTSNDKELTSFSKAHKLAMIPADKPETDADRQEVKDMTTQTAQLKT